MKQVQINKIKIYPFKSKNDLINYVIDKRKILIAINAEKILKKDTKLQSIINDNIGYSDGIGAVLVLKKKGYHIKRIPGVELWHDIIDRYHKTKSFYFIGSTQDVIEETVSKLKIEYPNINIKGYRNGFLREGDINRIKTDLLKKKPDIVFVAMGTPKQEFIMQELIEAYPALYQGLGGSFDVYSGRIKRAPKIFQVTGLEWLYRLLLQPTRIKRQLIYVKFVIKLIFNHL